MSFLDTLAFYFAYPFIRYALIVGVLIALCSSLLGVTLVLKRFSFIGDGLSHVAFGAIAIAAVLNLSNQMILVFPITIVCAILLLRTGQNTKIKGDRRHCYDFCRSTGNRLSDYESVLRFLQCIRRCVQHTVRLYLYSDPDAGRGLAVCDSVARCHCYLYFVLQQNFCCDFR